jgi:hypothetical protein
VEAHGPGENQSLQFSPLTHHVFDRVAMRDSAHVLFDDGALVQLRRHIMGCGTNDLDPALLGLLVGARACEGGQERVVDVDDASLSALRK